MGKRRKGQGLSKGKPKGQHGANGIHGGPDKKADSCRTESDTKLQSSKKGYCRDLPVSELVRMFQP